MEEKETEWVKLRYYGSYFRVFMLEVYKACYMNELLGYGIGIFQGEIAFFYSLPVFSRNKLIP